MSEITVTEHEIRPYFDMEGFMTLSQESRLGGATLERLCKLWEEWMPQLKVCEIKTAKISYLAVWLPESVEQQVDAAWEKSPSDGWQDNNLAQYMCMAAVQEVLPQVEDAGCAPAPRPTEALREALSGLGLEYREDAPTQPPFCSGDPLSLQGRLRDLPSAVQLPPRDRARARLPVWCCPATSRAPTNRHDPVAPGPQGSGASVRDG